MAYEVLPGNTQDKQTLQDMLDKISERYGDAERVWIMDRGIPTEEVLQKMNASEVPVGYLVGTPRGHLSKHEKALSLLSWEKVRDDVRVKLLPKEKEVYVLVESKARRLKEQAIRLRKMKKYVNRLKEIRDQKNIDRDSLLKKVGAAEKDAGRFCRLFDIRIPLEGEEINENTFFWRLNRDKYRKAWHREGKYFLRSNQVSKDPEELWKQYMVLTEVEESFRNLKGDLSLRPIYHRTMERIEAHIFISFLAYCLHVTLKQRAKSLAPGLTPRSIIEQMKAIQMIDVHIPTVDSRELKMSRYTKPEKAQQLLLAKLKLQLPPQPPPEIVAPRPNMVVW